MLKLRSIFKKYYHDETIPILHQKAPKCDLNYGTNRGHQQEEEKVPNYPVGVYFVLASKFLESFAANGVRCVLALYLHDALHFSRDRSTIVLHIFNFFSQFCPIIGAFIADGYIGNERSILCFFIIYAAGFVGITLTTLPTISEGDAISVIVYLSLWLISVGNGSIRATITSLGASQFKTPEQSRELDGYFSRYYFVYSAGILLSKTVTPSIRGFTRCFGENNCYLAVFGALSAIFLLCFVIFLVGLFFYVKDSRDLQQQHSTRDNVLFKVIGCILESLKRKFVIHNGGKFLENIQDRYDPEFIESVRLVLKITTLFAPLPIYWALLAQQDSSFTFQATKLKTNIFGWRIEPDQMKAVAPLMLLIMIPCWDKVVLPAIHKHTRFTITPVASITLGGISAAAAFICAGFLEAMIQRMTNQAISILWQLPQFTLLMIGELLLAIPGIQFAFTQAPASMKTVVTAVWFINNAFGNLIVVFITELKPVRRESLEYFLYATLMIIGILIYMIIASGFTTHEQQQQEQQQQ